MKNFFAAILLVFLLGSCSEYQKALKSEVPEVKYDAAAKMYEKGKYSKAIRLFEQISASFRGKPQAEQMYYMFAQSYYKTKQYYLAGYQFDSFSAAYPKSTYAEEAAFLAAKSYSMLSPVYSLDQTDTFKAIDKLQAFIDKYPDSQYLPEANVTVKSLREKIEKKVFLNARNYNKIADYKSALVASTISSQIIRERRTVKKRIITSSIQHTNLRSTAYRRKCRNGLKTRKQLTEP